MSVSRREVLRNGALVGGIVGLSGVSVVSADDTVEVPVAKSQDKVVRTRSVPVNVGTI